MKKILLLLVAAMLLPMAMSAQLLDNSNLKFQHAPYALKNFDSHTRLMAPARANLADNQMIMGHYDTDDYTTSGLGITGLPGTIPIATILTPSELATFQGGQIVKFRVALAAATSVTRVFVAPVSSTGAIGQLTEWTCSVRAVGWNEIALATPYEINLGDNESLLIGFDYAQTSSNYPISAVEVGEIYPSYIFADGAWQNVGLDAYGNLSIQCIVESDHFPDYMIGVSNLFTPGYTKAGDDIYFNFTSRNHGVVNNIPAEACSYDVLVDGEVVVTITNPDALNRNNTIIEGAISSDGLEIGKHTLTITVNSLNGEPVETPISVSRIFTIYESGFAHQMFLLEQFTSTYCQYCPLGVSMLEILMGLRNDIIWVGVHGNMGGTDPMRTLQCDSIMSYEGADSYPSGTFNRSVGFESSEYIANGLGFNTAYHQEVAQEISNFYDGLGEVPSFSTVNINSTYDADTRQVVITIDGELSPDFDKLLGADSKLTVYITEDGIVARQLNGSRWVTNFVHNGVMRKALNSVKGNSLNRDGNKYKNEFTFTIPSTWNADNLNVVAFISRPLTNGASGVYSDMFVDQANKRKLGEYDEPATFLRGDVDGDERVSIADVTALIDYLLTLDESLINLDAADCDLDENVSIADVTALIDYLLTGTWEDE